MTKLENSSFIACISEHGAELKSLECKQNGRNYIYDGSAGWKRSAPVLFPNIGGLAGEKFIFDGAVLPALPHGFARDMDFVVTESDDEHAVFMLESSEETKKYFPFSFVLSITYTLENKGISVTWDVDNRGKTPMYFSIGAHLTDYKDHVSDKRRSIHLSPELLEKDAIILEDTGIEKLELRSKKYNYYLAIHFPDFPVVAIWTDPHQVTNAKFICLEPWCGINSLCNDEMDDISRKNRINKLDVDQTFTRSYTISVIE